MPYLEELIAIGACLNQKGITQAKNLTALHISDVENLNHLKRLKVLQISCRSRISNDGISILTQLHTLCINNNNNMITLID